MTLGTALSFTVGLLSGCALAALLHGFLRRRELKTRLNDDDDAVRALYERLRRAEQAAAGADGPTGAIGGLRLSIRRLLDRSVELIAVAAAADTRLGTAAEYERGARMTLGSAKGLLDCHDILAVPWSEGQRRSARQLLERVTALRRLLARQIERCRSDGSILVETEGERVAMLEKALLADETMVDSDPLRALELLGKQLGVINEVLAEMELKTMKLPQA